MGHDNYAPCDLEDLRAKGYDYWALGHVHGHQVLSEDPWVVYPGCPQGRHIREQGPKGCFLLEVTDGAIASAEFVRTDQVCWEVLTVEVGEDCQSLEDAESAFAEAMTAADLDAAVTALRVEFVGATPAHATLAAQTSTLADRVRGLVVGLGQHDVWIEKVQVRAAPPRGSLADSPLAGEIQSMLAGLMDGSEGFGPYLNDAQIDQLVTKIGRDLKVTPDNREAWVRELMPRIEAVLMAGLRGEVP